MSEIQLSRRRPKVPRSLAGEVSVWAQPSPKPH
jgi:hypothetical protein